MKASPAGRKTPEIEPVRVLGRGLRGLRGVQMPIRVVREASGKTQVDIAAATGIDQGDISRLERRVDFACQVATLRRYIEAVGGKLELTAVFGNKKMNSRASVTHSAAGQQRRAADRNKYGNLAARRLTAVATPRAGVAAADGGTVGPTREFTSAVPFARLKVE